MVLGMDGFGCFDSCVNLCCFFEVDVNYIVVVVMVDFYCEGNVIKV